MNRSNGRGGKLSRPAVGRAQTIKRTNLGPCRPAVPRRRAHTQGRIVARVLPMALIHGPRCGALGAIAPQWERGHHQAGRKESNLVSTRVCRTRSRGAAAPGRRPQDPQRHAPQLAIHLHSPPRHKRTNSAPPNHQGSGAYGPSVRCLDATSMSPTDNGCESDQRLTAGLPWERPGDRRAFGATIGSLWVSQDQGDCWQRVSTHLPAISCVRYG